MMSKTIGTKAACAVAAIAMTAIGSPAFAASSVPPSDLSWTPVEPAPGGNLAVSFKGCNPGESVLVRVAATSAGWLYDNTATATDPGEVNSVSMTLDNPVTAPGQQFAVGIYCGGVWTDAEGRWVRAYGTIGEAEVTTTTTTAPPSTTPTTATASPSTTLQSTVGSNNAARTAAAVSGVPNFAG